LRDRSSPWKLDDLNHRLSPDIHPMRICIFGAGAVGSHLAVRLARAGHEVGCVMRGPHLDAVRAKGLTLRTGADEWSAPVTASWVRWAPSTKLSMRVSVEAVMVCPS